MLDNKLKDNALNTFGEKAFSHGLFYQHEASLRFELSMGGSNLEMFQTAYAKGLEILDFIFSEQTDLHVCITFYGRKYISPLSNFSILKQLDKLHLKRPESYYFWETYCPQDECFPDEEPLLRNFIIFPIAYNQLHKFLWSSIATDLGIHPTVDGETYFFSPSLEILAHPYDDRGMDVIGTNNNLKQELFETFHDYLLDYDLAEMKQHFGN